MICHCLTAEQVVVILAVIFVLAIIIWVLLGR
jgi:hypothetical protein